MRELLRHNRRFRLLWISDILAYFATWSATIVLLHLVHQEMGTNLAQALLLTAQFLPAFFLLPLAGHILDRFDRRKTVIVSKLINGSLALVLLFASEVLPVEAIFAIFVLHSASITLFIVASAAWLPSVVQPDQLAKANILFRMTPSLMLVLSGLFMAEHTGAGNDLEFVLIAVLYLGSAAVVGAMGHVPTAPRESSDDQRGVFRNLWAGLRYLFSDRRLIPVFAIRMALYVGVGGQVLLSIFAESVFERGEQGVGLLYISRGAGLLAGTCLLLFLAVASAASTLRIVGWGLGLSGLGFLLAGLSPPLGIGLTAVCFALAFIGEGIGKTLTMTLLQQRTEHRYLGRVMAAEQGLSALVQSGAALVIGASVVTADAGSAQIACAVTGLVLLAMGVAWLVGNARASRAAGVDETPPVA